MRSGQLAYALGLAGVRGVHVQTDNSAEREARRNRQTREVQSRQNKKANLRWDIDRIDCSDRP